MYVLLKYAHTFLAIVTIAGFVLRGAWMVRDSALLSHRITRVAPHIVDTLFLLTGIVMVYMAAIPVMRSAWLLAKFAGLIAYIVLGAIALRRGPTREIRLVALVGALSAFAYVVGVALSRSPASWLAYLGP